MVSLKIFLLIFTGLLILGIGLQDSLGQNQQEEVSTRSETSKAIPDWLKNNFRWYLDGQISQKELLTSINWLLDNNYMHLSEDSAREVQELRDQVAHLKEVLAGTTKPTDPNSDKNDIESGLVDDLRSLSVLSEHQSKVNKLVISTINNKTQSFEEWSDIILKIRNDVSRTTSSPEIQNDSAKIDSTAGDLQKLAILFNTAFDKESGILASEINLISEMPKIKALTQEDSTIDTFQAIEKNYWLGKLGKTNEKIVSLKTGVTALQDYFNLIEPNLKSDVTNASILEEIQKQKERINEISNELDHQQDAIEIIIQNIRTYG